MAPHNAHISALRPESNNRAEERSTQQDNSPVCLVAGQIPQPKMDGRNSIWPARSEMLKNISHRARHRKHTHNVQGALGDETPL